jgi:predicted transposase YdaD
VESVVVLLHPKANLRAINGLHERWLPGQTEPYLRFRYRVIRVWELPVETVLQAGISILPLAPISAVREDELPAVIERMGHRFATVADRTEVAELWTATGVLLGMRYAGPFVESLLRGVREMEESTFYQSIMAKGRLQEARRLLLRVGEDRFGVAPTPEQQAGIEALADAGRIEELVVRAAHVDSWAELLKPPPAPGTPRRRRKS